MKDRYYVRESNLKNLFTMMSLEFGEIINLNFIEDFYINLFKGTAHKVTFPKETEINEDLRKRYNIFLEWKEAEGEKILPEKEYYTFIDNPNPCHLIKIMKDKFNRSDNSTGVEYAFINIKELGKGKAGTASLLGYYPSTTENKLKIAAKLMNSNQFTLTNKGSFLPLNIIYFDKEASNAKVARLDKNLRFIYPENSIKEIKANYQGYEKYNIFNTNHPQYKEIMLSVASDNFSNQTIMHMILEDILTKYENDNYVKQYDAMLCLTNQDKFDETQQKTYVQNLKEGLTSMMGFIGDKLNITEPEVDGLNFMEIADEGDLYGHLFEVQKKYFSKIRVPKDLDNNDESQFRNDWNIASGQGQRQELSGKSYYHSLRYFFSNMIKQILMTMAILQHPKYAFVHGDLKTKNIFVAKSSGDIRNYVYKIADYDKSSINYNGIRFHNEGNKLIQFIKGYYGPDIFMKGDNVDLKSTEKKGLISNLYENIKDYNPLINKPEKIEYKFNLDKNDKATQDGFTELFNNSEINPIQIIYDLLIDYINKIESNAEIQFIPERMEYFYKLGLNKSSFYNMIKKSLIKIYESINTNRDTITNKISEIEKEEKLEKKIKKCIDFLIEIKNNGNSIDLFYSLNTYIARLSNVVTGLEGIELEQFFVRYLPTPFYHTIDLYSLFLSLLQSPMVFTYLKYCFKNKNKDLIKSDIFWNSFRDLFIDDDIYTIFGYFEYLYKNPSNEDMASIGFILDPIKKNPISLIKSVPDNYWERIFEWHREKVYKPSKKWNKIKEDIGGDTTRNKNLKLTTGSKTIMPNICLSQTCNNFDMKMHRGNAVFYVNKDLIVYNTTTIGEKVKSLQGIKKKFEENAIEKYNNTLQQSIYYYIKEKIRKNEIDDLIKKFNYKMDNQEEYTEPEKQKEWLDTELRKTISTGWTSSKFFEDINNTKENKEEIEKIFKKIKESESYKKLVKNKLIELIEASNGSINLTDNNEYPERIEKRLKVIIEQMSGKQREVLEYFNNLMNKFYNLEEGERLKEYVEKKFKKDNFKLGDISNVCKTNSYKDIFGNKVNWDYCFNTDREVEEVIDFIFNSRQVSESSSGGYKSKKIYRLKNNLVFFGKTCNISFP